MVLVNQLDWLLIFQNEKFMGILKNLSLALFISLIFSGTGFSQCENNLPTLMADLASSPTASTTVTIGGIGLGKCCDAQFGDPSCQVLQLNLHPSVRGLSFSLPSIDDCNIIVYEAADCPLGFGLSLCGQICTNQTSLEYLICKEGDFEETTLSINSTDCCLGLPFAPGTTCEGSDLTLNSTAFDSEVQHAWYTEDPALNPASLISTEKITAVSGLPVGVHNFWLVLSSTDCTTEAMQVSTEIFPIPQITISQSGGTCGEDIQLMSTALPLGDYVYLWSGPNGFFSTEQNPIISNPTPENEGVYTLNVFDNAGCSSPIASYTLENLSNFNVELDIFLTSISACFGDDVNIFTTFIAGDNIQYFWTFMNLLGQTENFVTSEPNLLLPSISEDQNGVYSVYASDGTCETEPSDLLEIEVQSVLNQASITGETMLCEGQTLNLSTDIIPDAQYNWTGPNGFSSDESSISIENITSDMAGTYTLEVILNFCFSEPISVEVEVLDVFTEETTLFSTSLFICEGDELTLFTNFVNGDNITYNWTQINLLGQSLNFTTTEPLLIFNPVTPDQNGMYTVSASQGSCVSNPAPLLEIDVQESIGSPAINGNTSFCAGETLTLSTDEILNASYLWIGPNNFSSTENTFEIQNASQDISGTYTLEITINGCTSEISSIEVNILSGINETLTITSSSLVSCEGESLTLLTNQINAADVIYHWTMINLMGQSETFETTEPVLTFDPVSLSQSGVYTVYASIGSCESEAAESIEIEIEEIPSAPNINGITELCPGDNIELSTVLIPDATYVWTGPNGFMSTDSSITIENIDSSMIGLYNLQIIINGCASEETNIGINLNELPPAFAAGNDGPYCEGEDVNLFVIGADLSLTYNWYDMNTGALIGTGSNLTLNADMVSDGQGYFVRVTNAAGCTYDPIAANDLNALTTVTFVSTPLMNAEAGNDGLSCDGSFNLNAIPVSSTGSIFGFWSTIDGSQEIQDPLAASTIVNGLSQGENVFVWQIDDGVCGIISSDTVSITLFEAAVAENDAYLTSTNTSLVLDPLNNDNLTQGNFEISSITDFAGGEATLNSDGTIAFTPTPGFNGQLSFTYTLCSVDCPSLCSDAVVRIDVEGSNECIIPTMITPNGDDYNDAFTIYCLSSFPGSTLKIFNRWGEKIYESQDYQNDWLGTYENEALPAGTYFYVLEINDGLDNPQNGYIYIQRN